MYCYQINVFEVPQMFDVTQQCMYVICINKKKHTNKIEKPKKRESERKENMMVKWRIQIKRKIFLTKLQK